MIKTQLKSCLLVLICLFTLSSFNNIRAEYDIAEIYKGTSLEGKAKALTSEGLSDVDLILTPISIDNGKYVVNVTKKAKDVYKIDGKNIYIQTKYCYEYSGEVVLKIEGGYFKGKIIF